MRAFLDVQYEDGDQSTYKGIEISADRNVLKTFNSGDFTIDFIDYLFWVDDNDEIFVVSYLSSWNHFFMDGDKYRGMLIDHNEENKVVTDFSNLPLMDFHKLTEYPVTEDITTFEQLKEYYFSKRPKKK